MIRPTFVIALGGTGTDIVKHLQTRLKLRYGTADFDTLKYLFLDTDATNNKIITDRPDVAFALFPKDDKVNKLMGATSEEAQNLKLGRWMDPSLWSGLSPQSFSQGVQGKRMYGRLAFLSAENLRVISRYISVTLQALKGHVGEGGGGLNQDEKIRILVVASAGGGTGSGTFLDMGYFLRHLIARGNLISSCSLEGIAAIAVSDDFSGREYAQNSLALMEELEFFSQAGNVFEARYADADLDPKIGLQRPYDYPFLVSPMNHDSPMGPNSRVALDQLKWKIADYLFLRTVDEGGTNNIGARMPDMITNFGETARLSGQKSGHFDGLGYPLTFMTVGVSLRQLPKALADKHDKRQIRADFVKRWLKEADGAQPSLPNSQFTGLQIKSGDLDFLRGQLGLLEDHKMASNGKSPERVIKEDNIADLLMYTGNKTAIKEALEKDAARNDVDSAFETYVEGQPLEAHLSGYVAGTVAVNLQKLRRTDSGVKKRIFERLWDAASDFERGPRYTLSLITELIKRMDADTALMEEAQRMTLPSGGQAHKTLNVKLKKSLLEAKQKLYQEIRSELQGESSNADASGSITERLKYLIRYVQEWQKAGEEGAEEERNLYERARIEMKPTVLAMPERSLEERLALQQGVGRETVRPIIDWAQRQEFSARLPRDAGRETNPIQFRVFSMLEDRLETLRAENGGMPGILEQLEKECEGVWGTEAVRELNESRVMLTLNLSADGYGDDLGTDKVPRAFKWFAMVNKSQGGADQDGKTLYQKYRDAVNSKFSSYGELVKGGQTALDWEEGFRDTDLLALVSLRASFPTRIISHYHADVDRPGLIRAHEMPYTQIGISRPIDLDQLKRAEKCLLVGEVFARCPSLDMGVPRIAPSNDGATHIYIYRPLGKDVDEPWQYSKRFDTAVGDLARKLDVIKALEGDIATVLQSGHVEGILREEIIRHLTELQKLIELSNQGIGDYTDLDLWEIPYREVKNVLQLWMSEQKWSVPDTLHAWAEPYGTKWRCKKCGNEYAAKPTMNECARATCKFSG